MLYWKRFRGITILAAAVAMGSFILSHSAAADQSRAALQKNGAHGTVRKSASDNARTRFLPSSPMVAPVGVGGGSNESNGDGATATAGSAALATLLPWNATFCPNPVPTICGVGVQYSTQCSSGITSTACPGRVTPTHCADNHSTVETQCPNGQTISTTCPNGTVTPTNCAAGPTPTVCPSGGISTNCPSGVVAPTMCPNYQVTATFCQDWFITQPTNCPGNVTYPTECPDGDICTAPTQCPTGETYATNCPDGRYVPTNCPENEGDGGDCGAVRAARAPICPDNADRDASVTTPKSTEGAASNR